MPDIFHLTAVDTFDPTGKLLNLSIYQGTATSFIIYYPEVDLSTYTFTGHIRKNYADKTNVVLNSFNFDCSYQTVAGKEGTYSVITVKLYPSQTSLLPQTTNRTSNSEPVIGLNVLLYDIEAVNPSDNEDVIKLIYPSYIEVRGEVTR